MMNSNNSNNNQALQETEDEEEQHDIQQEEYFTSLIIVKYSLYVGRPRLYCTRRPPSVPNTLTRQPTPASTESGGGVEAEAGWPYMYSVQRGSSCAI